MSEQSKIEERHMRARKAAHDEVTRNGGNINTAIYEAIETATRVKITPEARHAAIKASGYGYDIPSDAYDRIIEATLTELGFEVES